MILILAARVSANNFTRGGGCMATGPLPETTWTHGRFFEQKEAFSRDVVDSIHREQRNRIEANSVFSQRGDHGVAQARCSFREAGFCFLPSARGRFCRRLLLAWLSEMLQASAVEPSLLGPKGPEESAARSARSTSSSCNGMDSPPDLGARIVAEE